MFCIVRSSSCCQSLGGLDVFTSFTVYLSIYFSNMFGVSYPPEVRRRALDHLSTRGRRNNPHLRQVIDSHLMIYIFQGRYIPDLYDLAHDAGWEPYNLHDLKSHSLGWVCTVQVLGNISPRQVRI